MPTYYVHYRYIKDGKPAGEGAQKFERPSDEEAIKKAQQFMKDCRENPGEPGLQYVYLRTVRAIDESFVK